MTRWLAALLTLFASRPTFVLADPPDWRALTQKPFEKLSLPDPGLKPVLVDAQGKKLDTVEAWEKAKPALQARWLERLGKPPEKPKDFEISALEKISHTGYSTELFSIHTEGGDRMRMYLVKPEGLKPDEKRPAVVVFHQTSRETLKESVGLGKKPELALGVHLAQRGYIALCPECYILKDPNGWAKGQAEVLEKRRPGWTGMGKMTFDASRCVDYLETLPYVDAKRIGCIGHSLGAKEVLYALAFEPRYAAGVFCEGGIGIKMSNWLDSWYLTERMKPHVGELEHHQLLSLIAPRPMLVVGGDSADGDASWPFLKAALPVYELYGKGDRIGLLNHKQKHSFPTEARRVGYRWLDHWLDFKPLKDAVGD